MSKVYILLADGFEAVEAVAPIDVMHRGGIEIVKVSVSGAANITSSHSIVTLIADMTLGEGLPLDADAIILPGGYPGYENLTSSEAVGRSVNEYYDAGRIVAAICGAPAVLAANHVGEGSIVTSHTSVRDRMGAYKHVGGSVVRDGNLITGAGAGVAVDFALAVAEAVEGDECVAKIKKGMEIR